VETNSIRYSGGCGWRPVSSQADLIQHVNDKAGAIWVGIIDHIEDRVVG